MKTLTERLREAITERLDAFGEFTEANLITQTYGERKRADASEWNQVTRDALQEILKEVEELERYAETAMPPVTA